MGFSNVAWESRSTERLARDLTDGPGPGPVGQAGAAWERIANEWASIAEGFDKAVAVIKDSFDSRGADAAVRKMEEFSQWLQTVSLSAASNGQRAEAAAVAYSVAVLGMPSVTDVVQARTTHDVMASLAAYNGSLLTGEFAEFDEAVTAHQATASAVMYTYEEACAPLAVPWEQAPAPQVTDGAAIKAETGAEAAGDHTGGRAAAGRGEAVAPVPLLPFRANEVKSTGNSKDSPKNESIGVSPAAAGPGVGGYGPMGAMARGSAATREHHPAFAGSIEGSGESGAGVSGTEPSWLPTTRHSDAPFTVSHLSWGPNSSIFDELAEPAEPEPPEYAAVPRPTLEQVSNRWVAPPVIGADRGLPE
jgi:PPE family